MCSHFVVSSLIFICYTCSKSRKYCQGDTWCIYLLTFNFLPGYSITSNADENGVCYLIPSIALFSRLPSGSEVFRSREFQHHKTVLKSRGRRRGSWVLCSHCNHLGTLPKCDSILIPFPLLKHSWGPIMCTKNPNRILHDIITHVALCRPTNSGENHNIVYFILIAIS